MTLVTKKTHFSFVRHSVGGLFVVLASGCSGMPEVQLAAGVDPASDGSGNAEPESTERIDSNASYSESGYAHGWIRCGFLKLDTDESGADVGVPEDYHPGKINAILAANPEYQVATGLSEILNCADVETYKAGVAEYLHEHPDFQPQRGALMDLDDDSLANAELESIEVDADSGLVTEDEEVSKIYLGNSEQNSSVYQISVIMPATETVPWSVESCTAVRIADTLFLTAAHCIPPDVTAETSPRPVLMTKTTVSFRTPSGAILYNVGNTYVHAFTKRHVWFDGTNPEWDIGLIYIKKEWQSYFGNGNTGAKIASRIPKFGSWLDVYGFGTTVVPRTVDRRAQSQNHATGYLSSFITDSVTGDNEEAIRMSSVNIKTCVGDSGGGAFTQYPLKLLTGVTSSNDRRRTDECATVDTGYGYWTTLHRKIGGFIMPTMKLLQRMHPEVLPFKCRYHDGVSATAAVRAYNDPASYYYCDKK